MEAAEGERSELKADLETLRSKKGEE